ncbi:MAG: SpoIIE family protein phosphatase, partial [Gammaproteobacteria bacterium]|nr:SpoIIE family protein phosphatase [Gammaproteobacteria bacterium]
ADSDTLVLVVADGVGGLPSGSQASKILVEKISKACINYRKDDLELRDALLSGIESANHEIIGSSSGSATTLAAVEIQNSYIRTYHVGDSAILVVGQKGKLILETVLHSPTGYAVESGFMSEDEALLHEDRHIVSNVIGASDMHISMSVPVKLKKFDTLMIATDGIIDNIDKPTIIQTIRKGNLNDCLNKLLDITNERMNSGDNSYKPDDASCILFRRSPQDE